VEAILAQGKSIGGMILTAFLTKPESTSGSDYGNEVAVHDATTATSTATTFGESRESK
jgi:hypothetical protein